MLRAENGKEEEKRGANFLGGSHICFTERRGERERERVFGRSIGKKGLRELLFRYNNRRSGGSRHVACAANITSGKDEGKRESCLAAAALSLILRRDEIALLLKV